jgi:hypothetical protein
MLNEVEPTKHIDEVTAMVGKNYIRELNVI